jgi:hypothetical protein
MLRFLAPILAPVFAPIFAAALAFAAPALAQAPLPGRTPPTKVLAFDSRLTKADTARLAADADRLLFAPLLATPALQDPHGFSVVRSLSIKPPAFGLPRTGPSAVRGNVLLQPVDPARGSRPDPSGAYNGVGEGPAIEFTLNDPTALFATAGAEETRPEFLELDLGRPARAGFPVLRLGLRDVLVIAKPGRTPYRLVTRAELLERQIGDRAQTLAQLGPAAAPVLRQAQASQQAELAALAPDQRAAPACVGGDHARGTFSACNDRGARHLVAIDPAYFDPALPKTAIQLITLSVQAAGRDELSPLTPRTRAAVDSLDLAALQRALR